MIDFRKLEIWQRSHLLVVEIYKATNDLPASELYGLTSQLKRAAISIPSNIAEACGRNSDGELARFLTFAMGSSAEVEYQLLLAKDLGFLSIEKYNLLNNETIQIRKMLNSFIKKVNSRRT
jgi:four helix bundle protein